jgi:transposase InsO family protein
VKFAFIDAQKARHKVHALCRLLGVSRSGYYAWKKRSTAPRRAQDQRLAAQVAQIHARSRGVYGSPRVHAALRATGVLVARKRVERLMREQGLRGRAPRRYRATTDSEHTLPVAPNVVERDFEVTAPNEVWVTDVTYVATREGWLFLAVMVDLFSRRVVGWATSARNDTSLALEALRSAVRARQPPRGLLHHSDRGSPYASDAYRAELDAHGIARSMSRRGDCWDNAVAESFFGTLKRELVPEAGYPSRARAHEAIADFIDDFYNLHRRHSHNGYLSPVEFELRRQRSRKAA